MRRLLLVSVAVLGSPSVIGLALAQPAAPGAPSQGQAAYPLVNPTAYVNNNNNSQAPAIKGALPNPTPGTIVVHINGRVMTEIQSIWTSADERFSASPSGVVKLDPIAVQSYARLYFGADAMATNGLRYGAGIELRQNFTGQVSSNSSSNASNNSSLQTLYVRRAFTYMAGDNWGLVRAGTADGIIGLFDNGVTTFQFLPSGNLNGGDAQNMPGNVVPPFWFLSQTGAEYAYAKIVYLSPQIAGFDFGLQYAPNTWNGFGLSSGNPYNAALAGSGIGTGVACNVANTGCPTLSSGPGILDGARILNQTTLGVRYQGVFGGVGVLAYGVYGFSGHANYSGPTTAAVLGTAGLPGSRFNGQYNSLSFGNGGIAITYGGFTIGGNVIGGRLNGQLALAPQGGVGEFAYTLGAKYTSGPLTVGIVGEIGWYQGNVQMSGLSQRRGRAIDVGASYTVAPGFQVFGEYVWNDIQQGGVDMISGATGSNFNNNIKGHGFLIGNVVNF